MNKNRNRLLPLIAAVVLLASHGFAQRGDPERSHARLVREVRHELVMLPYYSVFDDLQFKVEGGTVTLMGAVRNAQLKSDAENVVKDIEGVEEVINQIEVLPLSSVDDQIRRQVYFALFSENSSLFRYGWGAVPSIHIIVSGGRVTLTGVVDSEADKNMAGLLVQKVPGIFSVTNNLRVGKSE